MKKFSLISAIEKGLKITSDYKRESFFNHIHRIINCSGISVLSDIITDDTSDLQDFFRLRHHDGRNKTIDAIIDINHDYGMINYFEG